MATAKKERASTGDPQLDALALAKDAYESLGSDIAWEEQNTYQIDQMRSVAASILAHQIGGATDFEIACLAALGLPDPTPTLGGLDPATAVSPGDPLVLGCNGSKFTGDSVIYFAGGPLLTALIDPTRLEANIDPSAWPPGNYAVFVRTPHAKDTEAQMFSMSQAQAAPGPSHTKAHAPQPQPAKVEEKKTPPKK